MQLEAGRWCELVWSDSAWLRLSERPLDHLGEIERVAMAGGNFDRRGGMLFIDGAGAVVVGRATDEAQHELVDAYPRRRQR